MRIEAERKLIESYLQHRLDPRITVQQIEAALPGIRDEGASWDRKVEHHWAFQADDQECAIWDMRGLRWSAFGPKEVFEQLGLEVIGGPDDFEKAWNMARETAR